VTLEEKLAIERRLTELTAQGGGRLTPEAVVQDAENPQSPLHTKIFGESDREAAYQRRLELARQLIRSVRVNVTIDQRSISVVGYVHDPSTHSSGYVPTASLINERERALQVVLREFARVEAIITRSREIAEVLGLRAELESMLNNLQQFVAAARAAAA
jgi:hypothetical protein